MDAPRYLCSHLVRLVGDGAEQWANLEEIWESGVVLECEEAVPSGASAWLLAESHTYPCRVMSVKAHAFGYRVELAFSPEVLWRIEDWEPDHALDPEKLKR